MNIRATWRAAWQNVAYRARAIDYLSRHGGTEQANPKNEGLGNIRELESWQAVAEDTDFRLLVSKDAA